MDDIDYTEDVLVEQPTIKLLKTLGWKTAYCFHEFDQAGGSPLGRETPAEAVLLQRLWAALEKLNPTLPSEAITQAIEELVRDRSSKDGWAYSGTPRAAAKASP